MRIMIVGTGYVGLVTGVCFSEFGFNVIGVDTDAAKIAKLQQGEVPIFEPGLQDLLQKNLAAKNLTFSTDLIGNLPAVDLVFLAVGTPSSESGAVDLSFILNAARSIAENLSNFMTIVIKSTVPPGTCNILKQEILRINPAAKFALVSNPEFLREGSAVRDFMQPDRIIIGIEQEHSRDVMQKLYKPLQLQRVPILFTTLETAELSKYAANAFLATKIAFINEMADICESVGADVQFVAQAMGLDQRIGPLFLQAGPGFGGSCFPKDCLALQNFAEAQGTPSKIVSAVLTSNQNRRAALVDRIVAACGGSVSGKEVAVLGVAFKANTDDIRESPALEIIPALLAQGAKIRIFDPQAMPNAQQYFGEQVGIRYPKSLKECLCNAHAAVIITEWPEFKNMNLPEVAGLLCPFAPNSPRVLIDLRNLFIAHDFLGINMRYVSIGRPVAEPNLATICENIND